MQTSASKRLDVTIATGAGAISKVTALAKKFKLVGITVHTSGAWTNAFTISLDAKDGTTYDTVLKTITPPTGGSTDFNWSPGQGEEGMYTFEAGDEVLIAATNPGTTTYGIRIVTEEL